MYYLPLFKKEKNILSLWSHPSLRFFTVRRWTGRKQKWWMEKNGTKWKRGFRLAPRKGGAVGVRVSELWGQEEREGRGRWVSTHGFGPFFSQCCDLGCRLPANVTELEGHFLLLTSAQKRQKYSSRDEWCLNLACLTHESVKVGEWLPGPFRFLLHHQKILTAFWKKKCGEINELVEGYISNWC